MSEAGSVRAEEKNAVTEISYVWSDEIVKRKCLPFTLEFKADNDQITKLVLRNTWDISIRLNNMSVSIVQVRKLDLKLPDQEMIPDSTITISIDATYKSPGDLEWILPDVVNLKSFPVFLTDSGERKRLIGIASCIADCTHCISDEVRMLVSFDIRQELGNDRYQSVGAFVNSLGGMVELYMAPEYPDSDTMEMSGHAGFITDSVISNDGRYIFSCCSNNCIAKWDLRNGCCVRFIEAHESEVTAIFNTGDMIVSNSKDGKIKAFDHHLQFIRTLGSDTSNPISSVVNATLGKLICTLRDKTVHIWDPDMNESIQQLKFDDDTKDIKSAIFIDDDTILSMHRDKKFRVWGVSDGVCSKCTEAAAEHPFGASRLIMNRDRSLIISHCRFADVLWRWPDLTRLCSVGEGKNSVAFHPSNPDMLLVCRLSQICRFDISNNKLLKPPIIEDIRPGNLSFTADNSRMIVQSGFSLRLFSSF